jgi:hypothetical protein
MKSIKTLRFTKSVIAIAIAAGGFSTSSIAAATINITGTQDNGNICGSGYTNALNDRSLTCFKTSTVVAKLKCADPAFPRYVARAVGSPGTPQGRDICTRSNIFVTSTSDIRTLLRGTDYVFAKP